MAHLEGLVHLESLSVANTSWVNSNMKITDAGLIHLARFTRLRQLNNANVQWSDLHELKRLKTLPLLMPTISPGDVRRLQDALPETYVSAAWGGSSIAPRQVSKGVIFPLP